MYQVRYPTLFVLEKKSGNLEDTFSGNFALSELRFVPIHLIDVEIFHRVTAASSATNTSLNIYLLHCIAIDTKDKLNTVTITNMLPQYLYRLRSVRQAEGK